MKALAKIAALAVSVIMAASAFGCGSSDSASQTSNPGFEPESIQINDAGFCITDEGMLSYAFVAVNPNDGYVAEDVVFTIEAYDASGSMIAGDSQTMSALYPGAETPGAGVTEMFSLDSDDPQVANLSIAALTDSITWNATTITNDDIESSLHIVSPRMSTSSSDGTLSIKASIDLAEGDDLKLNASSPIELRAVALLFDESGAAICGTEPVIFTLDPENPTYDLAASIADAPQYSKGDLYVTLTA